MAQNIYKSASQRLTISILLISFLAACGNVRFSGGGSTDGAATQTGITDNLPGGTNTPGDDGNTPGIGNNTPGDDGNTPGIGNTPGNDGSTPGTLPPSGPRNVSYSLQVPANKNQVDFLLVVDNSASMIAIQQKMAASMTALAAQMNTLNIDWQMCLTTTTDMNLGGTAAGTGTHTCTGPYCTGNYASGTWAWGVSLPWANGNYVLNKTGLNANSNIFNETIPKIGSGDSGTGDERGIKAAYNHFANWKAGAHNTANCYRNGSSVAVILVSDEDERSVAGNCSRVNTTLGDKEIPACRNYEAPNAIRVLEFQDQPTNLVSQATAIFGNTARFTFNSIIADTDACQNQLNQNASFIREGIPYFSPHYTGTIYKQASQLTNGGIASLCTSDLKLNLFSDVVLNKLDKLSLECAPTKLEARLGDTKAAAEASAPLATNRYTVNGAVISFIPALTENQWVSLSYTCPAQ